VLLVREFVVRLLRHVRHVAASRKALAGTRDDDDLDLGVGGSLGERTLELAHQASVQGV